MSHIKTKEELLKLKDNAIRIIKSDDNITILSNFCNLAVPKYDNGKSMVGVVVASNSKRKPGYMPAQNTIYIPSRSFIEIAENSAKALANFYEYEDIDKLKKYYEIFGILHETEHAYQFLITNGKINFPYPEVKEGYQRLISFLYNKYSIVRNPILARKNIKSFKLYNMFPYDYILERNANVEAANDTSLLAKEIGEDKVGEIFDSLALSYTNFGYEDDNLGCMYHTYDELMPKKEYDKITKDENMTDEERIRFGLKISEQTHKKLQKKIESSKIII